MKLASGWVALAFFVTGALTPLTQTLAADSALAAAKVEKTEAGKPARVRVQATAVERLGIKTTLVRDEEKAGKSGTIRQKVIPYSAVLYDLDGKTWAYTNPEALVFVRQRIEVDSIRGELAMLSDGPPAGTPVVSVGGAELLGIELGVGK